MRFLNFPGLCGQPSLFILEYMWVWVSVGLSGVGLVVFTYNYERVDDNIASTSAFVVALAFVLRLKQSHTWKSFIHIFAKSSEGALSCCGIAIIITNVAQ